jgi:hypothetical protein
MPRCSHTYADTSQCKRIVSAEQGYCYSHDPARASERQRNAARGGKAKATGEMGRVKSRLQALADMVEEGQMDRADAAVIGQIWGTYIRAVGMELRVKEFEEMAREVEELREIVEMNKGRGGYGA